MGPARSQALAAAGLRTVRDLILHPPFRYQHRRAFAAGEVRGAAGGGGG